MIDANIVADGGQVLGSFAQQCHDEVLWDAAQTEAPDHDGGSVVNVCYRLIRIFDDLLHTISSSRIMR